MVYDNNIRAVDYTYMPIMEGAGGMTREQAPDLPSALLDKRIVFVGTPVGHFIATLEGGLEVVIQLDSRVLPVVPFGYFTDLLQEPFFLLHVTSIGMQL